MCRGSANAILGFSGSIRDLNLLQYAKNLIDKRDEPNIDYEYIITKFVPNVQKLFSNNGRNTNDKGVDSIDSYYLLGYKDKMWLIDFDYCVLLEKESYNSIGSGKSYALGSLKTTEKLNLTPIERIRLALQSASKFDTGVAPPFYIINTDNDEIIEYLD